MRFRRPRTIERELLAFKNPDKAYVAEHNTAEAVFEIVGSEIRIPFIARTEKGDMKALMDRMVEELDHNRFRFVAISSNDLLRETGLAPDDAQDIRKAVHGFEEEVLEEYENSDGEIEPVETLVGDWKPGEYDE